MTINGVQQFDLEIGLETGKKVHLLGEVSPEALEGISGELRRGLWAPRPRDPASA